MTDAALDYEVGDTHEVEFQTLVRQFLFCKNSRECGEKTNFHRKIQRIPYKNSPLSAHWTIKDAGALRWKKFFSPLFTANLTLFFDKTSTRISDSLPEKWAMPKSWVFVTRVQPNYGQWNFQSFQKLTVSYFEKSLFLRGYLGLLLFTNSNNFCLYFFI